MKSLVTLFLFCLYVLLAFKPVSTYRVKYQLTYYPDSTNLKGKAAETFYLYLPTNGQSFYASENLLKRDSISQLLKRGALTEADIMADSRNRFQTRFAQFVIKNYQQQSIRCFETIGVLPYTYTIKNTLQWAITTQTDTVAGYPCVKATTKFGGRDYEAWFTPAIPISDGPFVFSGLPGLIVKLNDVKNHYTFMLQSFVSYTGKITEIPTYRTQQPISIDRAKAFALREDCRKDPLGHFSRTTGNSLEGATSQLHGSSEVVPLKAALPDRRWDNNPLELK